MQETPKANRVHIVFVGLRNAGKSTLVNAFCNQEVAIVSDIPGTTTDPVSKAMEILPLGPCLITDTAGLDDGGVLGEQRVRRTLEVMASADIVIWVGEGLDAWRNRIHVPIVEYHRGDDIAALKEKIAAIRQEEVPGLLEGLVNAGDRVTLVCPIDEAAPKGRLILPQVQVLRECLDRHVIARVIQVEEFVDDGSLTIVDSQVFGKVKARNLTSFSLLFARQKGDLAEFRNGLEIARSLRDGDRVLVAEACTHHRQCNDIGTSRIPEALERLCDAKLDFLFSSGNDFPVSSDLKLIVHCGGCMLTRRAMQTRIAAAKAAGVPIVNYGILLKAQNA